MSGQRSAILTAALLGSADLRIYFSGPWAFKREMQALDGTPLGSAEGRAEFMPQAVANVLQYRESGQLMLLGQVRAIGFSRRFDYHWQDDVLQVLFADGPQAGQSYQHYRFDPVRQALLPVATHVCVQDHYDGCYQLIDRDQFDLQTRIEGPHKAYLLRSHFSRVAGS